MKQFLLIIRYPTAVFNMHIAAFPKKNKNAPIPLVMKNEASFLSASTNADIAEVQKFSPVKAT